MAGFVALLRGINVGTAKAVSMAELADVFERLGFDDVRTVLRSGNVVFDGAGQTPDRMAASIEAAVLEATGVRSSVIVLSADEFARVAEANPLVKVATDGSKSFVTFLASPMPPLEVPDAATLAPEVLSVGADAIYQWMPDGSLQTKVPKSFWKQFDGPVTARNWNTVERLLALLRG